VIQKKTLTEKAAAMIMK